MRLLFGIILGILITVGGAYIHDASRAPSGASAERPMVNWDVVGDNMRALRARAVAEWSRLLGS